MVICRAINGFIGGAGKNMRRAGDMKTANRE
jgi:hypothetical protein